MGYNLSQLKVLVVDDNPQMTELVKTLLEVVGISKVRTAPNADIGWEVFKTFNPDLLITDWNMTPTNGIDFVLRVRRTKESPNPYLPVIMLTGYTERYRVEEARDAGVTEFLAKPVTPKSLFERLNAVIEDKRNFVVASTYVGPDRRRRDQPFDGPDRRQVAT
ncbi:MAG: response regulator [Alphaproteobacteria bacterium]|nr:response regulator [Alphaproteobacteria bacterium]